MSKELKTKKEMIEGNLMAFFAIASITMLVSGKGNKEEGTSFIKDVEKHAARIADEIIGDLEKYEEKAPAEQAA